MSVDLRVVGISKSRKMLLDDRGIDLSSWEVALDTEGVPADLEEFSSYLANSHIPHSLVIDTSASGAVPHLCSPRRLIGPHPLLDEPASISEGAFSD